MARTVDISGKSCEVVALKRDFKTDPKWEILAPEGYLIDGELTGLICYSMQDVRERASNATPE